MSPSSALILSTVQSRGAGGHSVRAAHLGCYRLQYHLLRDENMILLLDGRFQCTMKNTVVGGVITLNDIICQPVTTHGQGDVIIE